MQRMDTVARLAQAVDIVTAQIFDVYNWKAPTTGVVAWEGPSPIDGAPIVVIVTGIDKPSGNSKTGAVAQTYIIRADVAPGVARTDGRDVSICGDCPQRWFLGGGCYVDPRGMSSVWAKYQRGGYPPATEVDLAAIAARFKVRAGTYGDPAMVPGEVWAKLGVWTGYTHQWRQPWAQDLKSAVMASCDSEEDLQHARALGWRSFLVTASEDISGAIECPSVRGVTCEACGLCGGLQTPTARDIRIAPHGPAKRRALAVVN